MHQHSEPNRTKTADGKVRKNLFKSSYKSYYRSNRFYKQYKHLPSNKEMGNGGTWSRIAAAPHFGDSGVENSFVHHRKASMWEGFSQCVSACQQLHLYYMVRSLNTL